MQSTERGSQATARAPTLLLQIGLLLAAAVLSLLLMEAQPTPAAQGPPTGTPGPYPIQNIIVIMMENNSFDTLFGTYNQVNPSANGLQVFTPQPGGTPTPLPQLQLNGVPYQTFPPPGLQVTLTGTATPGGPPTTTPTSGPSPTPVQCIPDPRLPPSLYPGNAPWQIPSS